MKKIYLGESPPSNGRFFYDKDSECKPGVWSHRLFEKEGHDLPESRALTAEQKERHLRRLSDTGVILVDACMCAVNHMEKDVNRDTFVFDCFHRYSSDLLRTLMKGRNVEIPIRFAFPVECGNELLEKLKGQYPDVRRW